MARQNMMVILQVDCKHVTQHLEEVKPRFVVYEVVEQVAYVDRIILNKVDLVSEEELAALNTRIKGINSMVQIKQAMFGAVDMDLVLGVGGYDLDRIESEVQVDKPHCSSHHHVHQGGHDSAVTSVSIVCEGNLDLDEVDDWLDRLVEEKGVDLYRMKGILSVNDSDECYVFQGIHSMLDGSPGKLNNHQRKLTQWIW